MMGQTSIGARPAAGSAQISLQNPVFPHEGVDGSKLLVWHLPMIITDLRSSVGRENSGVSPWPGLHRSRRPASLTSRSQVCCVLFEATAATLARYPTHANAPCRICKPSQYTG